MRELFTARIVGRIQRTRESVELVYTRPILKATLTIRLTPSKGAASVQPDNGDETSRDSGALMPKVFNLLTFVVLTNACREPGNPSAVAPAANGGQRAANVFADAVSREADLIRALRSRYPADQQAALMARLEEKAGVTAIVQLNDPESQRLFDEILDVRRSKRVPPAEAVRIQRVVVAFPITDHADSSVTLIRLPPTVISGAIVGSQSVLIVPHDAQSPEAFERVMLALPQELAALSASGRLDSPRMIDWRRIVPPMQHSMTVAPVVARGPVQQIQSIGFVRTFPILVDTSRH